ncbi:hypothetical protein GOBAR_AA04450 [Gossypium barbadense]|uniref:Uncharacterized protein n=1 Tax=Gossypium barbadense TaxID=3634 RepID=A0A2P5YKR9_GOSBA|nr:hypothetical protein GOBAR_AA04450 [Gossypium barbadense]
MVWGGCVKKLRRLGLGILGKGTSEIRHTPVLFGHVGAHGRVARPCPTSFASSTPMFKCTRLCCFISLEHGWWARACHTPVLNSQSQPRFIDMDMSHARVVLTESPMATLHGCGNLLYLVLGKEFSLFPHGRTAWPCLLLWCEHGLRHALVPGRMD